jgi:arylformamidase
MPDIFSLEQAMTLIDISRVISPRALVFPGDRPIRMEPVCVIGPASPYRITRLEWTTHMTTHLDAPAHFRVDGATLDALPLERFTGEALVVDVPYECRSIGPELVPPEAEVRGRSILFRTRHSAHFDSTRFDEDHVYLTGEAARALAARGANLVGIDYLDVDHHGDENYPAHNALLGAGVLIMEGLDLSAAPAGRYRLFAFPLRIENADGSPVRAVLEELRINN